MGCSKDSSKREAHSEKCLHQEARKISNNLILKFKEVEKEGKMNYNSRRKKKKIRVEISKIKTKKEIEKIKETNSCGFFLFMIKCDKSLDHKEKN